MSGTSGGKLLGHLTKRGSSGGSWSSVLGREPRASGGARRARPDSPRAGKQVCGLSRCTRAYVESTATPCRVFQPTTGSKSSSTSSADPGRRRWAPDRREDRGSPRPCPRHEERRAGGGLEVDGRPGLGAGRSKEHFGLETCSTGEVRPCRASVRPSPARLVHQPRAPCGRGGGHPSSWRTIEHVVARQPFSSTLGRGGARPRRAGAGHPAARVRQVEVEACALAGGALDRPHDDRLDAGEPGQRRDPRQLVAATFDQRCESARRRTSIPLRIRRRPTNHRTRAIQLSSVTPRARAGRRRSRAAG